MTQVAKVAQVPQTCQLTLAESWFYLPRRGRTQEGDVLAVYFAMNISREHGDIHRSDYPTFCIKGSEGAKGSEGLSNVPIDANGIIEIYPLSRKGGRGDSSHWRDEMLCETSV